MGEQYGDLDYQSFERIGDPEDKVTARRVVIKKTEDDDGDKQEIRADGRAYITNSQSEFTLKQILEEMKAMNLHLQKITELQ